MLIGGGGASNEEVNLQKGLIGWWKFNGNAKDSTPYGNNGTVTGATLTTDRKGQVNKAYSFDGSNDDIQISSTPQVDYNNNFSIALWANVADFTQDASNCGDKRSYLISQYVTDAFHTIKFIANIGTPNTISFAVRDTAMPSVATGVLSINQWYHLVGVRSGNSIMLYNNGVLMGTADITGLSFTNINSGIFYIGNGDTNSCSVNYFNGLIDEVRIYNRTLTDVEVTALYQEYDPGIQVSDLQKGLVGQWKFDGNAKDSTPYGNNGTVTGATLTTDRKGQVNKAYSFNGTSDYVNAGNITAVSQNGPATIEGWFNFNQFAMAKGTHVPMHSQLYQHSSNNQFYLGGGGADFFAVGATLSLNTWYHIVLTYNGTHETALLYINGVKYNVTVQIPNSDHASLSPFRIGETNFGGLIDDVRIYNRALSAAEVTALYESY